MPQTTFSNTMTKAWAGMECDNLQGSTDSYVSEEASAEVPFGVAVVQGTGDFGAKLFAAGTDKPVGLVRYSAAYNKSNELGSTGLKPKVTMSIKKRGTMYVTVDEAVTPASPVRVRNDGATAGTFRTSASAGHTVDWSKFARFLETTTGAGVVKLEFDMTMRALAVAD